MGGRHLLFHRLELGQPGQHFLSQEVSLDQFLVTSLQEPLEEGNALREGIGFGLIALQEFDEPVLRLGELADPLKVLPQRVFHPGRQVVLRELVQERLDGLSDVRR